LPLRLQFTPRVGGGSAFFVRRLRTHPMRIVYLLFLAVGALMPCAGLSGAEPPAPDQHPITKLLPIEIPDEVSSVSWSASRSDEYACAIQISFIPVREGKPQPAHPKTQVWLLKADGTVIPQTNVAQRIGFGNAGHNTEMDSYAYPRSATEDAFAVVVSIGERLFVERLRSDPK